MPSWNEVRSHVRRRYAVYRADEVFLEMAWAHRVEGVEVNQAVRIEPVRAFDEDWLLVLAPLCRDEQLDGTHRWLVHNFRLAIGCLAVDWGIAYLRHSARLDTLDLADLERAIEFLAGEAAIIRGELARPSFAGCPIQGY